MSLIGTRMKPSTSGPKPACTLGLPVALRVAMRAAMKGLLVDHDLGALDALVVAELARQLQRRLVGFQAGGAEEHVGHARQLHQLGGQLLPACGTW